MDDQDPANQSPQNEPPVVDEAAERQERAALLHSAAPLKRKRRWPKVLAIVILILLLAGGGAYWKFGMHKAKPAAPPAAKSQQPAAQTNVPTKQYTSTNFNLSFNYPETWTVTDSSTAQLTVVSPATTLTGADGQTMTGQITLTIRQKGQRLTAFDKGNGTAVQDSQKVSYSNPTSSQRAQTYLTYVQYPATTAAGALDAIYITGDFGYQKGQAVPQVDLAQIDPLTAVTFAKCSDSTCTTTAATNILATSWSGATATTTETMLKSLSFE